MRRHLFAFLLSLGCALGAPPAFAQDIVELNEQGIAAFAEGRFEDAALKFREAYSIKPEQTLKKNEALAWFKAEKCQEALVAANEYLGLEPTDEVSIGEARTVIAKCSVQKAEASIAAGDLDAAETALGVAKQQSPDEETSQQIADVEAELATERKAAEEERKRKLAEAEAKRQAEAEAGATSTQRTLGIALTSAGGAVFVGALIYHLVMATSVAPEFKDVAAAGEDPDKYDRLGGQLETANWLAPTLYAVGAATAGVGAYFWFVASDTEVQTADGPRPRGGSFGVSLTWRFQ